MVKQGSGNTETQTSTVGVLGGKRNFEDSMEISNYPCKRQDLDVSFLSGGANSEAAETAEQSRRAL